VSALTFRVNVPIFKGFSTKAKIEKAQLDLEKSINQRENLELSIDNDIETASNTFTTAINTLNNQKKNMDLATTIYDQTRKKFESGVGSTLEISNAQADLRIAQTNYITAMYDAIIAKIDYLRAVGKL
jgi:outer membrane protein TolC